jgi:hypothetical protein
MHAMNKSLTNTLATAALLLTSAVSARAGFVVDTGLPNGKAVGAFAFDSSDFYAGQIVFSNASQIESVAAHVLGGTAGETFTVALYSDNAAHLPGDSLYSATATFGTEGWNGLSGLTGWDVSAGNYWVAFEISFNDTLGGASDTGALLDRGVPSPLSRTAFNAGGGYQLGNPPLDFGVQVGAIAAVPEPAVSVLMVMGLGGVGLMARRRQSQPKVTC